MQLIVPCPDHPFYVAGKWIDVRFLSKGSPLTTYNDEVVAIDSIKLVRGKFKVYNFEVDEYHTYYVSKDKLLVHNMSCAVNLPPLKGKTVSGVEKILKKNGMNKTKDTGRNQTWNHSDGSEVRVHKYGNKNPSGHKSGNNAHVHKEDPSRNQLDDKGNISTDKGKTQSV